MIFGLTVGRNEAHRYLKPMMEAASETLDLVYYYDDQSTDGTLDIVEEYASVTIRPHNVPSFLENEGAFRGHAWHMFEKVMKPFDGDWVLVIDCDEVLVGNHGIPTEKALRTVVERPPEEVAIDLSIPEVFGFENQVPLVRKDGFWGTIHAPRLFRYKKGGRFTGNGMGASSRPGYVDAQFGRWASTDLVYLMHYGYADSEDRLQKYRRYKGLAGHSSTHIDSIIKPPDLVKWSGSFDPRMRRRG